MVELDNNENNKSDVTSKNVDKPWQFKEGNAGGPGRPKVTEEQKVIKKALKELVTDYKEGLAQVLPKISPILMEKALKGDMVAIKEIHAIVVGEAPKDINLMTERIPLLRFEDEVQGHNSIQEDNSSAK